MSLKILYVTTIGGTMRFFVSFVRRLIDEGHIVDIATNEEASPVPECYREWGCEVYRISCTRSPLDWDNQKAVRELRCIVQDNGYDLVHCHTPIAAACTRLACRRLRRNGMRIFYTAHGFHFYTGAPLQNWLVYFPVEWVCSWWTDVLITINHEDYNRARHHLHAKRTEYVPGVGVDTKKFKPKESGRQRIRTELGLTDTATMILSVGELNENKNHATVIRAIAGMDLTYVIVGRGAKADKLKGLADELCVDLRLMGFRNDVVDFYDAADVYVLPSHREGLNVSLMEAMASGLPCACGNIRGNRDLIDGVDGTLFDPADISEVRGAIVAALERKVTLGEKNIEKVLSFDLSVIQDLMTKIYAESVCD